MRHGVRELRKHPGRRHDRMFRNGRGRPRPVGVAMKIKVVVHEVEEGGYWAEVPAIPGCATQGETFEELLENLYEAIEGCLSVDVEKPKRGQKKRVVEIAV